MAPRGEGGNPCGYSFANRQTNRQNREKVDEVKQLILCFGVIQKVKVDGGKQLILCFGVIQMVKVDEGNS